MMPRRNDANPPKPQEAIDFLRNKQIVESQHWDELKWGEHAHAFTVAHSAGAAILNDLHGILIEAMKNGQSYQQTKREIKQLMVKKGWYGKAGINPDTESPEERKRAGQYINWRLKIIYQTNQLTAYSAGQTRKMWSVQHIYPFWQYKQQQRKNKRQAHSAYHNMILPADDPQWDTLTPPNGWRCACYRSPLTPEQASKEWQAGAKREVPQDALPIDPTWAYNPAKEALAPNWKSYESLRKAGALRGIMQNYRNDIAQVQMSSGEWQKYSRTVLEKESGSTQIPVHMATLEQVVIDSLLKNYNQIFDPKLMATDKALRHGARGRAGGRRKKSEGFDPKRDLTVEQIGNMPPNLASPDTIYKDGKEFLFVYKLDNEYEARVVFRQNDNRPLQLVTFMKVRLGEKVSGEGIYKK